MKIEIHTVDIDDRSEVRLIFWAILVSIVQQYYDKLELITLTRNMEILEVGKCIINNLHTMETLSNIATDSININTNNTFHEARIGRLC